MNKTIARTLLAAGCLSVFSGCITHSETEVRDVERVKVEFENETAGRIFYEALSRKPAHRAHSESNTEVVIPVVFENKHKVITGPNAEFNEAVAYCDSNKDGRITVVEANIFLEERHKH